MNFYQLIWHYNPPDSIQSHPNTLQTPYRHPPDTPQTPQNVVLFGVGGHWEKRQYDDFYSTVYDLYDICTPPDICQTPPDMIQTPSDTHRHHPDNPQTQAFLLIRGHWKERQYLSWHDFYTFLPTDLVLIHPQTHSDSIQTPSDTIQTPPGIGLFMQYKAPV